MTLLLDVHGVTGSSPVPRTIGNLVTIMVARFFSLPKSGFSLIFSLMKSPDRNGLNKLLHTLCAILLHLLRDVSVNI